MSLGCLLLAKDFAHDMFSLMLMLGLTSLTEKLNHSTLWSSLKVSMGQVAQREEAFLPPVMSDTYALGPVRFLPGVPRSQSPILLSPSGPQPLHPLPACGELSRPGSASCQIRRDVPRIELARQTASLSPVTSKLASGSTPGLGPGWQPPTRAVGLA